MKNTLSVNLKGCDYGKEFIADENQNFKIGDRIFVKHYYNNNSEWNCADHLDIVKADCGECDEGIIDGWKHNPSYSHNNITSYVIGIKTVSRVFKTKIWCK